MGSGKGLTKRSRAITPSTTNRFSLLILWKIFVDESGTSQQLIHEYYLGDEKNWRGIDRYDIYSQLLTEIVKDMLSVGSLARTHPAPIEDLKVITRPGSWGTGDRGVIQLLHNGSVDRESEFDILGIDGYLGEGTTLESVTNFFERSNFLDAWERL